MQQTGRITEFTRDHIPRVADLWGRAYRNREGPAPDSLRAYFEAIYFQNPWRDPELPSFVYVSDAGEVCGFVGLVPRPMTFEGRPIRAHVLSTIMVDPRARGQAIGMRLMQRAFSGPQDLIFTDGANDACRKLWQAAGGELCFLLSCLWTRSLRPAQHALAQGAQRPALRAIATVLRPVAAVFDALVVRAPVGPYRLPQSAMRGDEASAADILACREELGSVAALLPSYDAHSFGWLLDATAEATARGRLERILVRDEAGRRVGWYVYFANPGGLCELMQLGGALETIELVLLHLFRHAWRRGGVELRGRFEPGFASALLDVHCEFTFHLSVLAHSRNPALMRAMHAGATGLSRLDGEWWMHFADGPWS